MCTIIIILPIYFIQSMKHLYYIYIYIYITWNGVKEENRNVKFYLDLWNFPDKRFLKR